MNSTPPRRAQARQFTVAAWIGSDLTAGAEGDAKGRAGQKMAQTALPWLRGQAG